MATSSKAYEQAMTVNRKARQKRQILNVFRYVAAIAVTLVMIFPLFWMLSTSLKTEQELMSARPPLWPAEMQFINYSYVFQRAPFMLYIMNTAVVTVMQMTFQLVTGIFAAYGFSKGRFYGKNLLFLLVLGALMIPIQVTFIPLYITVARMNMINTYMGIVIASCVSPYTIFMLRQAFMGVDNSYLDAAKVDGMGKIGVIFRILTPMCKPTLITVGLLSFIGGWNGYFWPKIITNNDTHRVLTVGLTKLKSTYGGEVVSNYHQIMAGVVVSIIPVLIMFLIFQKHMLSGYTKAAMK